MSIYQREGITTSIKSLTRENYKFYFTIRNIYDLWHNIYLNIFKCIVHIKKSTQTKNQMKAI